MDQNSMVYSDGEEVRDHRSGERERQAAASRRKGSTGRGGSYQGRFLNNTISKQEARRRRIRKQIRRIRLLRVMAGLFLLVLLASIILMVHSCVSGSPIVGDWKMDSMTSYEFYENWEGALVVPRGQYSFTYTIDGDQLSIDFHDEKAHDSQFTYELDDDVLTLVGGNKDVKGTYVLQKQ